MTAQCRARRKPQNRERGQDMDRAELKAVRAQAQRARAAALDAGDYSAAATLDRLFNAHRARAISAPQYAEAVQAAAIRISRQRTEQADALKGAVNHAATSTQSAYSRKVAPSAREGYQTVRTGQRIEVRQDIAGNEYEQSIALFKTVRPASAPVVSGAEAQKGRRVDAQRAERAERRRQAQRAQRQAERAALVAEAERRAAERTVKAETDAERQRREDYADAQRAAEIAKHSPDYTARRLAAQPDSGQRGQSTHPLIIAERRRIAAERAQTQD